MTEFDRVFAPVPSLQVRVYRARAYFMRVCGGSLTASEGVSGMPKVLSIASKFPHCK